MSVKRSVLVLAVVAIVAVAGMAAAQATTILEVKRGTVVSVWDNDLVVKMSDGVTRHVEVPEGFTFNVDGKELPVSALKPGMNLTAVVKTTTEPVEVKTTEVKKGRVLKATGRVVVIRNTETGETKKYTVPSDFPFWVDGVEKTVYDLREGMNVTAHIVHTNVEIVTERDAQVAASSPAKAKAAAAPKRAAAAPAAPAALPKTGSLLPLTGLAGIALLLLGIGIAVIRRF